METDCLFPYILRLIDADCVEKARIKSGASRRVEVKKKKKLRAILMQSKTFSFTFSFFCLWKNGLKLFITNAVFREQDLCNKSYSLFGLLAILGFSRTVIPSEKVLGGHPQDLINHQKGFQTKRIPRAEAEAGFLLRGVYGFTYRNTQVLLR